MFINVGKKIKGLAKFICWIGIILSILTAVAIFVLCIYAQINGLYVNFLDFRINNLTYFWIEGFMFLILGPIISWVSSFLLYGLGELIDEVSLIEQNTRNLDLDCQSQFKVNFFRIMNIEKLHTQGVITDEEYQKQREEIIKSL